MLPGAQEDKHGHHSRLFLSMGPLIGWPKKRRGNQCAILFVNYLTKWPEVYATQDQIAPTIASLLVEEFISRHRVPNQLFSDCGPSFLSNLPLEVSKVMVIHKVNTNAYHPQSDGLVERFNRTLTEMLSKW